MGTFIDYFYNGALRWSFGFENPNKAAIIFVCLLPLLFLLWNLAWDWKKAWWLKVIGIVVAGILITGVSLCLFKTYSRGGCVAAAVAVAYFLFHAGWRRRPSPWALVFRSAHFNVTCVLLGLLIALFAWVGLGSRSLEPISTGDASVGNRLVLWRSALQMATENPRGFGTGHSGESYMQWYQPGASTNGYRTMVNSYLTFLVEQGWFWFVIALMAVTLFGSWAQPETPDFARFSVVVGLRASILAFLVSGIFSTVMEEPVLWIIPICCALILAVWSLFARITFSWPKLTFSATTVLVVLIALYVSGLIQSRADPISRKFIHGPDGSTISELSLKKESSGKTTWVVVPDVKVLGPYYGKLLRQLVTETGATLQFKKAGELHIPPAHLIVVGDAVKGHIFYSTASTILLAPARISEAEALAWTASSSSILVLLPSIDEDRRVRFWKDYLSMAKPSHGSATTLQGVGTRVDWDWEDVIQLVKQTQPYSE